MYTTCVPPSFKLSGKIFGFCHPLVSSCKENKHFATCHPSFHKIATTMIFMYCQGSKINFTLFQQYRPRPMCFTKANLIRFYCGNDFPFFTSFKLRYFPLIPLLSPRYITGRGDNENNKGQKINPLITRMATKAKPNKDKGFTILI